ncbi:BBP7 family outer membrane beta-barrel protein [Planctomicrobium piriforme]|uniref:Putative beta barrel porin-7 (BBP7) n=1 Tax=Planctomicrobium piriforme TaxID=1576369 RepID=A0A1I3R0I5_9PLAN|nr:BBP7 family outer membrane beta-barrel protein [Planctomicrobium piriforme]SFJ39262.1 Putative beta barrel porin-7 (BBP7) [Planctomicrobium piriforme]
MSVRVPCEWLIVVSIFAGQLAWAQDWPAQPGGYGGAMQAQYAAPAGAGYGAPECPPGAAYGPPVGVPNMYDDLLPADRGWCYDTDSRRDLNFHEMLRGTWGRIEYLQGNISHQGGRTLGTPIDVPNPAALGQAQFDVADPSQQFPVLLTYLTTPPPFPPEQIIRQAQVPTTNTVNWNHAQGIRGSFGVPVLDAVWVEGRAWGYQEREGTLKTPSLPGTPLDLDDGTLQGPNGSLATTFLATSLLLDGAPSSTLILYDSGFTSSYDTLFRGGDVALAFNWITPQEGWRLQPIVGYRHDEYSEALSFGGSFNNSSAYYNIPVYATTQTNNITSKVRNLRDQIELGTRTEWKKSFLTLGLQERIAMGSNIARGSVSTTNLLQPGTPEGTVPDSTTNSNDRRVVFAPSFDMDVYCNIQMNRWLSFRVGYNLMWIGHTGVADQSIRFNQITTGAGVVPDVGSSLDFRDRTISALTIGGEITLP